MLKEVEVFTEHGGALDAARRLFPSAPHPWLDLSTGINPVAYPVGALPPEAWRHLPSATALTTLEAAAAARYGVCTTATVVAAPGTQSIIQRLPVLCKGGDVRLLGSTYSEFERVFRDFKRAVRIVSMPDRLIGADVAVVVNPNNPDGRQIAPQDLLALSERVGMLVVDEAFTDLLRSAASVAPLATSDRVIVLRSFGKTYGLPGVRLGFALASKGVGARLRRLLGPWPVSGPALAIGRTALSDESWIETSRRRLADHAHRLAFLLRQIGASVVGGTPLFTLISHPTAAALFTSLAEAGILTRPFAQEATWLRFGVPGTDPDWIRLEIALRAFDQGARTR